MLKRLASNKYSNLLGVFVSYDENKVLWIHPLVPTLHRKYKTWRNVLASDEDSGLIMIKCELLEQNEV